MGSKIILSLSEIKLIKHYVLNDKLSSAEITKKFNHKYTFKKIYNTIVEMGYKKEITEINKRAKSTKIKKAREQQMIDKFICIDNKYGKKFIPELVYSGAILNDLIEKTGMSSSTIVKYLKYKNINNIRIKNSREYISKLSRINGRKNTGGYELKQLTKEIKEYFLKLKNDGLFIGEVEQKLRNKYGMCSKKFSQLCKLYGKPLKNPQTEKLNPMYGKSPPYNSGKGISGHLLLLNKKIYFRSSLELFIYLYLYENNINFSLSEHRIKYIYNKTNKTYCPDIVIGDTIYEIKPSNMIGLKLNKLKFASLIQYCKTFNLKCEYITEKTYDLNDIISKTFINKLIEENKLTINDKQLKRLNKIFEGKHYYANKN